MIWADSTIINGQAYGRVRVARSIPRTGDPARAEDMGNLIARSQSIAGGWVQSLSDTFGCGRNVVPIAGQLPCDTASQMCFRQFYLAQPADLDVIGTFSSGSGASVSLFSGKATDGLVALSVFAPQFLCRQTNDSCLPAGWYTMVFYGKTGLYSDRPGDRPTRSVTGFIHYVRLRTTAINPTKFGTSRGASVQPGGLPWQIVYGADAASAAYPSTGRRYQLPAGNFGCSRNFPADSSQGGPCNRRQIMRCFYVIKTVAVSHLRISVDRVASSALYTFDVRTDSARLVTERPIHPCVTGIDGMDMARLPAGTYIFVYYADSGRAGPLPTPELEIDQPVASRYDHAASGQWL